MTWELALRRDLLTARQYGQFTVPFDRAGAGPQRHEGAARQPRCSAASRTAISVAERCAQGARPEPDSGWRSLHGELALQPVGTRRNPMSPDLRNDRTPSVAELRAEPHEDRRLCRRLRHALARPGRLRRDRASRRPSIRRCAGGCPARSTTTIPAPCSAARRRRCSCEGHARPGVHARPGADAGRPRCLRARAPRRCHRRLFGFRTKKDAWRQDGRRHRARAARHRDRRDLADGLPGLSARPM